MKPQEKVGLRVALLRKESGLNMVEFGKQFGHCREVISYIESGKRLPTIHLAVALCRKYNVTLDWLYAGMLEETQ